MSSFGTCCTTLQEIFAKNLFVKYLVSAQCVLDYGKRESSILKLWLVLLKISHHRNFSNCDLTLTHFRSYEIKKLFPHVNAYISHMGKSNFFLAAKVVKNYFMMSYNECLTTYVIWPSHNLIFHWLIKLRNGVVGNYYSW